MLTEYTVLMLADDSPAFRNLEWVLKHKGCRVLRMGSEAGRREALSLREFDLVLARINEEDGKDLTLLKQVKERHPQTRMILCSRDGETAFPLEAYQLEVDDYLLMPCRPAELWRRVLACLKRISGTPRRLAAAPGPAPLNLAFLEKCQRFFQYIHYNLDSSATALKPLINTPASGVDQKFMGKIHEVSARLELLQEMTEGFLRGLSGVNALSCSLVPVRNTGQCSLPRV